MHQHKLSSVSHSLLCCSRAEQLEAYTSIVNVHGELVLLCHWSMCAYTGIVKVGAARVSAPHTQQTGSVCSQCSRPAACLPCILPGG